MQQLNSEIFWVLSSVLFPEHTQTVWSSSACCGSSLLLWFTLMRNTPSWWSTWLSKFPPCDWLKFTMIALMSGQIIWTQLFWSRSRCAPYWKRVRSWRGWANGQVTIAGYLIEIVSLQLQMHESLPHFPITGQRWMVFSCVRDANAGIMTCYYEKIILSFYFAFKTLFFPSIVIHDSIIGIKCFVFTFITAGTWRRKDSNKVTTHLLLDLMLIVH